MAAAPSFGPVDRFLRAVHRRHVMLRAAERTGLGTLAGCGVALVLLPLLLWQGKAATEPCAAAVGLGAGLGLLWGITRRPTMLAAATEADRQLGLQDLLSTTLAVPRDHPDPWAMSLLAIADDRCRRLAPSAVILNRFGARAWGGIGLAASLVLVLILFTGSPTPSSAADAGGGGAAARTEGSALPEKPLLAVPVSPPRTGVSGRDNDAGTRPGGDVATETQAGDTAPVPKPSDDPGSVGTPSRGSPNSTGTGSSHTKPPDGPRRAEGPPAPADVDSRTPETERTGTKPAPTGGAGRAADPESGPPAGQSGATSAGSAAGAATPPWQAAGWQGDVERARQAVDRGDVPPAYRDLVRKYFDRQ